MQCLRVACVVCSDSVNVTEPSVGIYTVTHEAELEGFRHPISKFGIPIFLKMASTQQTAVDIKYTHIWCFSTVYYARTRFSAARFFPIPFLPFIDPLRASHKLWTMFPSVPSV